jgi:hypothetical protein
VTAGFVEVHCGAFSPVCGSLSSSLAAVLYDDAAVLYDCHNTAVMIRGTFRHDIQLYTVVNLTFFCNPAVGHAIPTDGECALMLLLVVVVVPGRCYTIILGQQAPGVAKV